MEKLHDASDHSKLFNHTCVKTWRSQYSQEFKNPHRHCFCDSWPWPHNKWFSGLIVEPAYSCLV